MRFAPTMRVFLMLACITAPASADTFLGIPSQSPGRPLPSPRFGTLINFDDKPTLSLVNANDYVLMGVASVTELEGLGRFARYPSSQSTPNYIGTGSTGERGGDSDSFGFDGTIQFQFAQAEGLVGIGIAETPGAQLPVLTVYDRNMNLLETFTPAFGLNVYAGLRRNENDIFFLRIRGDGFALDDLQFTRVPEPCTLLLFVGGFSLISLRRRLSLTSTPARSPL